jgi:hypothetical protein
LESHKALFDLCRPIGTYRLAHSISDDGGGFCFKRIPSHLLMWYGKDYKKRRDKLSMIFIIRYNYKTSTVKYE